jgi:ribosome biogenesis GTPase
MQLTDLGWTPHFDASFQPYAGQGLAPARVAREDRGLYRLWTEDAVLAARVTGRFSEGARWPADYPAVGDWVAVRPQPQGAAAICAMLPRTSCFARGAALGVPAEQVVAANVDTVFLMTGLDGDFNVRRIERYLAAAYGTGARPVVLLNKADLCDDPVGRVEEVELVAPGVPVHALSAAGGEGVGGLAPYLQSGQTVALLGSSGVGKSTLINALLGAPAMAVSEVRASDSHGRHTTTHRELVRLACGALVIDAPGMRELRLWGEEAAADSVFEDVAELARGCRFPDCSHQDEPDCAVQQALSDGVLALERFDSYLKLQCELRSAARRQAGKLRQAESAARRGDKQRANRRERRERRRRAGLREEF